MSREQSNKRALLFWVTGSVVLGCTIVGITWSSSKIEPVQSSASIDTTTQPVAGVVEPTGTPSPESDAATTPRAVKFDGLESVNVDFWEFKERIPISQSRVLDTYNKLVSAAESGDAASAFALYQDLYQCRDAYESKEKLQEAIELLYAERVLKTPRSPNPTHLRDSQLDNYEQMLTKAFYRCEGINGTQKFEESEQWLEVAANAGFLPAADRLAWTLYENEEFHRSRTFLDIAWQAGSAESTIGLYRLYKNGEGGVVADNVEAAAYLYLHDAINRAKLAGGYRAGGVIERMLDRNKSRLEAEFLGLKVREVDVAIERAREILVDNPNCCVNW